MSALSGNVRNNAQEDVSHGLMPMLTVRGSTTSRRHSGVRNLRHAEARRSSASQLHVPCLLSGWERSSLQYGYMTRREIFRLRFSTGIVRFPWCSSRKGLPRFDSLWWSPPRLASFRLTISHNSMIRSPPTSLWATPAPLVYLRDA